MLPAWYVDIEEALGPAVVLDPDLERHPVPGISGAFVVKATNQTLDQGADPTRADFSRVWNRPSSGGTRLAADGRTLTVQFGSSPAIASSSTGRPVTRWPSAWRAMASDGDQAAQNP
ncbi:MAG TPA: hypothetical protein VGX23_06985 [Actinocrinis sp.]|nr:hypothetical protein [Actinocrinis sp.]